MDAAPEPPLSLTQAQNPANHLWRTVARNKPPGPAFGRPDDKLRALRRSISNALAGVIVETSLAFVTGMAQCAALIAPYGPPQTIRRILRLRQRQWRFWGSVHANFNGGVAKRWTDTMSLNA